MDVDAARDGHVVGGGNNLRSTTAGFRVRRKHEPVESDVPRRRYSDWDSRSDRGSDMLADDVSCSVIDSSMGTFSQKNGQQTMAMGLGKDTVKRRLRSWGGIAGSMNEGVVATDLPRRRFPCEEKTTASGSDSEVLPVSLVSDGVSEGDVVELGVFGRDNTDNVDGPCTHAH